MSNSTEAMPLQEFADTRYALCHDIEPGTVRHICFVIRSFSRYLDTTATTAHLTSQHVNGYIRWYAAERSKYQASARRNVLCGLWKLADQLGMSEPFTRPRAVKTPEVVIKPLNRKQLGEAIEVANQLHGCFRFTQLPRAPYISTWIHVQWATSLHNCDMYRLEAASVLNSESGGRVTTIQKKNRHVKRDVIPEKVLDLVRDFWDGERKHIWPMVGGDKHHMCSVMRQLSRRLGWKITTTLIRKSAITHVERKSPGMGWVFAGHKSNRTTQHWYIDDESAYEDLPRPDTLLD